MKRLAALIIIVITFSYYLNSQSLFEDASGTASIYRLTDTYGWMRFNSSSSKISIGYNQFSNKDANRIIGGLSLDAKIGDGISTVFSKGEINPSVSLNGFLGEKINTENGVQFVFSRVSYGYEQVNMIDTFSLSSKKLTLPIWDASLHWNFRTLVSGKHYFVGGSSGGISWKNNFNKLSKVELISTLSNGGNSSIIKSESGRMGRIKELGVFNINGDIGWIPEIKEKNFIGFNLFGRGEVETEFKFNAGLGIFITQKNKPFNVLGGLAWQVDNIFGDNGKKNLSDLSSIFFYTGYYLNKN